MSYLIFSPTYIISVYPTCCAPTFYLPTHSVSLLFVYLSPKQVVVLGYLLFFSAMVSTCSSVSNANNTHTNDANAANDTNTYTDDANDANGNDADAADKADVDPFLVLTCKECRRFIDIQRIIIRTLISEFWLERGVYYYTTFNRPCGRVYEAALVDILELDHLIYEIIFARERWELYNSYVRNFPRGTFTGVCKH